MSGDGRYYRVVDCNEEMISLMRVNGYTLFSCNQRFLECSFRRVQPLEQAIA